MSHGLHKISHTLVADGSGRDMNIFQDGGWRGGNLRGFGKVPMYHPVFSLGEKPKLFVIAPGMSSHLRSDPDATAEGALSPDATAPRVFRMHGGATAMFFPKPDAALTAMRRSGSLAAAGADLTEVLDVKARSLSAPRPDTYGKKGKWKSRDTVGSFDAWSRRLPMNHTSEEQKKLTMRRS